MRFKSLKLFIFLVIATLTVCSAFVLSSCGGRDESLGDFAVKYADDYSVVSEDDGHSVVSVSAPDFREIAVIVFGENKGSDIDAKAIIDYAKQHPECKKEYLLDVENSTGEEIEKAFLDQIAYELMSSAIQSHEYSERWDTE